MDINLDRGLSDLGKCLLEAARIGDEDEVRQLLTKGASFTTDWLGTSALHLAAQNGHFNTALLLMRAGMSRDARTKVNKTPLHLASQFGHFKLVEAFIRQGADINAMDMLQMTPLHWAAENDYSDIASLLVRSGVDLSLKNKFDKTAADICAEKGHHRVLDSLKQSSTRSGKPTVTIPVVDSETASDSAKFSRMLPTAFLASLSALANVSSDSINSNVSLEDLALLQSGQLSAAPTNSLENIRSIILTDAGRLAMQLWNRETEDKLTVTRKNDGAVHENKSGKESITGSTSYLELQCENGANDETDLTGFSTSTLETRSRSVSASDTTCLAGDVPVSELFASPSSGQNMPFLPTFLDSNKAGECEDGCTLDLERDILPRQLEDARNIVASRDELNSKKS